MNPYFRLSGKSTHSFSPFVASIYLFYAVSCALLLQIQESHPDEVNRKDKIRKTLQKVARLRKQQSLPSPLWIIAAPLAQVSKPPLFMPPALLLY